MHREIRGRGEQRRPSLAMSSRLSEYLSREGAPYVVIPHRRDYSAQLTAHHTHTPGFAFAKVVVVRVDGEMAFAVLPAHEHVSLERLRAALGVEAVSVADEVEINALCPDCESGAPPPFGSLYGVNVYLSSSMADLDQITFNAGSHRNAIRMAFPDFLRLSGAQLVDFTSLH